MLSLIVQLTTLVVVLVGSSSGNFCGNTQVWRNNNETCPRAAICADVFTTTRDWLNGTRCDETRVLSNCMCDGNTACPVGDEAHMIYASKNHKQYTCRPTCSFSWCGYIPQRMSDSGRNSRRMWGGAPRPTAIEAHQQSPEFRGKTFYRLMCRCPRHHFPVQGRGVNRAVRAWSHRYNVLQGYHTTLYICNQRRGESSVDDICPPGSSN